MRIIVDDTSKPQRGKRMPGGGKSFDHVLHAYRWGHTYGVCLIEVNGQILPWGIALYLKKEWCQQHGQAFKKLTELAAGLIPSVVRAEVIPEGVEVVVLFESYYLCRTVVQAIPTGWFFVARLKSTRNLTVAGQKRKVGRYAKNLWRRRRQRIRGKNGSGRTGSSLVAGNTVRVSKIGPVSLVASRRGKEKKVVALVTNHPQLPDRDLVVAHGHRWVLEVFFKEAKQHWGLGEYQTRRLDGAVKHRHLSLIACALLTHAALKGRRDPANKNKDVLSPLRVEKLQTHLRGMIGRDLIRYIADRRKKPETQIQEIQSLLLAP